MSKIGLLIFGNSRGIAIQDAQAVAKPQVSLAKGEECYFLEKKEVGGGCFERKSIGGKRVQGDDGFFWLNSFSA